MRGLLDWFPHSREPEGGICLLNRLLSSDLRHKSTKILTAEVGTTPQGNSAPSGGGPAPGRCPGGCVHKSLQQTQSKGESSLSSCTFY